MTSHQLQEPLPYDLQKWNMWVAPAQKEDEYGANKFGEINGRLAALRAIIKHKNITDPSTVMSMLLPLDQELELWKTNLPITWYPTCYSSLPHVNDTQNVSFDSRYDVYPDLWVASMWNNYRTVRILIHETIMFITLKFGSSTDYAKLDYSTVVLRAMTNEICHTVPFHLGQCVDGIEPHLEPLKSEKTVPVPGAYLIIWPLFLCGMLRTTPSRQRQWIASRLLHIALTMGLRLAFNFAKELQQDDGQSFSAVDKWLIGEFRPQ
jgi:hypothetical protein